MGKSECRRYRQWKCEQRRQRLLELQKQKEACAMDDHSALFEDSLTYTTTMTTECSDTTTTSSSSTEGEPELRVLPTEASAFRDVAAQSQIFKYFLIEDGAIVAKWQRCRYRGGHDEITAARAAALKTREIVESMRRCMDTCGWEIDVQVPQEFMTRAVHGHPHGRRVLVENFVPDLVKANSNTGWFRPTKTTAGSVIQAIAHYSYAKSDGKLVVCNYYVSVDHKEKHITVVAPSIMTRKGGVYGAADLGLKGVRNFFRYFHCAGYNAGYKMPCHLEAHFTPTERTLLI